MRNALVLRTSRADGQYAMGLERQAWQILV